MRPNVCIGLVGGLGVGATVHYYEHLSRAFIENGITPRLVISHADVAHVLAYIRADELDSLADYLAEHIEMLGCAGAEFAAIGAVAPHICAPRLKERIRVPLVDVIDCTRAELTRRGARRVSVLGTKYVMQSDMCGGLEGFEVVRPGMDTIERVNTNYARIVSAGALQGSGADVEFIRETAQRLVRVENVDTVILAGTELSLAFDEADCGFPAIDCARVHIDAIVDRSFGRRTAMKEQHA